MNQQNSPTPHHPKPKHLAKSLNNYLKQVELLQETKSYEPGKISFVETSRCKPRIVNFFGDTHTEVFCMSPSPNEEYVSIGCSNGDIKVYSIFEGKILMMGNTSRLSGFPNTGIRFNPKSSKELVACNCDGTIKWYDVEKELVTGHNESEIGYLCVDYTSDGSFSIFGNEANEIKVFDTESKKLLRKYESSNFDSLNPNHTNRVFSIKGLKNDANLFFSGGWDSTVRIWDVRVGESVRKFGGPMVSSDSLDLKNNVLLSGNYSVKETVQLWDFNSGKLLSTVSLNESSSETMYSFAAQFCHKSKYNLSAVALSGINKIKVFENEVIIAEIQLQGSPLCLGFYRFNEKDFLVFSGVEGTIYAVKLKMEETC